MVQPEAEFPRRVWSQRWGWGSSPGSGDATLMSFAGPTRPSGLTTELPGGVAYGTPKSNESPSSGAFDAPDGSHSVTTATRVNMATETVGRHAAGRQGQAVALRWLGRSGHQVDLTYAALDVLANRFANVLVKLGVQRGDTVFTVLGRVPELYVTVVGSLRAGVVVAPLFAAFGPEPIRQRMQLGDARVVVTTEALYRRRVEPVRKDVETLDHVLVVGPNGTPTNVPHTHDFAAMIEQASTGFTPVDTSADDPALLHFTSGTTGTPKGAVHVHGAIESHLRTTREALSVQPGDTYWCTADPGWVTGMTYGITGPLACGATVVVDEADFDARRWYQIIEKNAVRVWYTAPTALRMLMRAGPDLARRYDLGSLRHVACVGEPLNAEVVRWFAEVAGVEVHDTWWQTETGSIQVANPPGQPVRPGAMGVPVAGATVGVGDVVGDAASDIGGDGPPSVRMATGPDAEGELLIRAPWPSMFQGYLGQPERYAACFVDGWYRTGDLVSRDADGYLWFVGRADDVIKSAGHLVGPFEVESALIEHRAVNEAGVIGVPDPVAGEAVKAFITLNEGVEATDELMLDVMGHARRRLGPAVAPRTIEVVDDLPHTRSGKVMRRLLKARELDLPVGDLSTLESTFEATVGSSAGSLAGGETGDNSSDAAQGNSHG